MLVRYIPEDADPREPMLIEMPRKTEEWRKLFNGNWNECIYFDRKKFILVTDETGGTARNTRATEMFKALLKKHEIMLYQGFIQGPVVVLDTEDKVIAYQRRGCTSPNQRITKAKAAKYGLTVWELHLLMQGSCPLCGDPAPNCVDHDHETGKARGYLCTTCNIGLGHYERFKRLGFEPVEEYLKRGLKDPDL